MQGVEIRQGWRRLRHVGACALVLLIAGVAPAFAQFDRGTISGTVKDSSGGVVPGVTVTATSTSTQQPRSTVTDGSGFYTFPNLQPGRYDISAELQGFKKNNRAGVQVDAASALTLDFALDAGRSPKSYGDRRSLDRFRRVAVRRRSSEGSSPVVQRRTRSECQRSGRVIGGSFNNAGPCR